MTMPRPTRLLAALFLLPLLLLAACGNDDGTKVRNDNGASGSGSGSASGTASDMGGMEHQGGECEEALAEPKPATVLDVKLQEYAVLPATTSAPAGQVGFVVTNAGKDAHEMVVVRAADAASLPTTADGAVDEDKLGADVIGEIAPFAGGKTCTATFDLTPGSYVLLCNVVESKAQAHFKLGMRTPFTVTG